MAASARTLADVGRYGLRPNEVITTTGRPSGEGHSASRLQLYSLPGRIDTDAEPAAQLCRICS
jgi:hypothetical protein